MQPILANELCKDLGSFSDNPQITGVITDSREAAPGTLFVCIKGERVDGHDFALAALQKGAAGILCQHDVEGVPQEKRILVKDPLDAMIQMGANYREHFSPLLLGVTGSVGKTTTKEFCYAVCSAFGSTLKTEGNQNNEIGVPKTLFRLDTTIRYGVVEMGMQALGEIEKLTLAVRPAGGIITWVGQSHLESLGTRENILKAKMEICDGMPDGAPLIINADNDLLSVAKVPQRLRRVTFAVHTDADVRAVGIQGDEKGTHFTICDKEFGSFPAFIPAMGEHNVADALSAYALATRLGLDPERAAQALANYSTTGHRQNVVQHCGVTVIEDCYNASPDSMKAALRTLAMQEDGHGRTLSALYYLLTGECYTPETAACCPGNFCRALRERFNEELKGAKQYREAAECWPEHRSMFLKLAQDESRHSRVLHGIACRMMRR